MHYIGQLLSGLFMNAEGSGWCSVVDSLCTLWDAVQITLEQIDLIKRLVDQYSDHLQLAQTAQGNKSTI